jgi:hypothetical protein
MKCSTDVRLELLCCVVAVGAMLPWGESLAAKDQTPTRSVNAADLLKDVQIIGTLGRPLGALVTIRGKWRRGDGKSASSVFVASSVDGKPLADTAEFSDYEMKPFWQTGKSVHTENEEWDWKVVSRADAKPPEPRVGEEWEVMGAESGTIRAPYANELFDEIGGAWMAMPPSGSVPQFRFIAVRHIDQAARQAAPTRRTQQSPAPRQQPARRANSRQRAR